MSSSASECLSSSTLPNTKYSSEDVCTSTLGTSSTLGSTSSTLGSSSTSESSRRSSVRQTESCPRPVSGRTSETTSRGVGSSSSSRTGSTSTVGRQGLGQQVRSPSSSECCWVPENGSSSGNCGSGASCSSSSSSSSTGPTTTSTGCRNTTTTCDASTSSRPDTRPENTRFEFVWRNDMTLHDFLDMCSKTANWCSQAANDCAQQWTSDANQNIDILRRDLGQVYQNLENVLTPRDMSTLTASELRQRTIEELYRQIKNDVVLCRDSCRCVTSVRTSSVRILDEVQRLLESEGFDVEYQLQPSSTIVTVEW